MPIEYLQLTVEDPDKLAAEAIGACTGPLTVEQVDAQIEARRELRVLIENGLDEPICPELANANPSSPHTVILEAIAQTLVAESAWRFNKVPQQNLIKFADLFGLEQRPATAATTTVRFTVDAPTEGTVVTIASGTEVQTEDGLFVFRTTETVTRMGDGTVDAPVERSVTGHTLLKPDVLNTMISIPAYVTGVTNPSAVDSGSEIEGLDKTLQRVAAFQKRGLRIVTTEDLEDAILVEGLLGNGIVRAFPFIENGNFTSGELKAGYTTVIAMTRTGDPIDSDASIRCAALVDQIVGNQFVYIVDPLYIEFNVTANVKCKNGTLQSDVIAAAKLNLQNFYSASREKFGRGIYVNDVVQVIESTPGVDHIPNGGLTSPLVDTELEEYQLAKVVDIELTAV